MARGMHNLISYKLYCCLRQPKTCFTHSIWQATEEDEEEREFQSL